MRVPPQFLFMQKNLVILFSRFTVLVDKFGRGKYVFFSKFCFDP